MQAHSAHARKKRTSRCQVYDQRLHKRQPFKLFVGHRNRFTDTRNSWPLIGHNPHRSAACRALSYCVRGPAMHATHAMPCSATNTQKRNPKHAPTHIEKVRNISRVPDMIWLLRYALHKVYVFNHWSCECAGGLSCQRWVSMSQQLSALCNWAFLKLTAVGPLF